VFLVLSYVAWAAGLRAGLVANTALLARTGTSTNVLSKAAHDLTRRLSRNPRAPAAAYEYGLARLTRVYLRRRKRPRLVGDRVRVPLVNGRRRRYVNLDYAASAPCLTSVKKAVDDLLPYYASVHRGTGYKSQVSTEAYEGAREAVGDFVGARDDDVVIFTRNTTDATNLLASALPAATEVIAFAAEHHANLLPWRRRELTMLPLPASPAEALDRLERALRRPAAGPRLVTVTGASNVTGEIWPYQEMAGLAHAHGARLMLDAAQLAPHRRIDMAAAHVDYLALSGHKLYAPFGAGALIGRPDWLGQGEPFLAGGGAVRYVGAGTVLWADLPDRQEAGSPNVIGAVALGVACRTLQHARRDDLEAYQTELVDETRRRLRTVPGIELYRLWPDGSPRIGVLPFALRTVPYARLAAILSAEYGIGVRHGCFCAHPLMAGLLKIDAEGEGRLRDGLARGETTALPGAVRASTGIGTTGADCDRLVTAVAEIASRGPRWAYTSTPDGAHCTPVPPLTGRTHRRNAR
jgi:selenocysteine lyase/cysteine desulfurase